MRYAVCLAALGAFSLPVHSQTEDSVVVTATRFPEDVRRLPASATVITAEDIQKSAARTIPELLQEQVGRQPQEERLTAEPFSVSCALYGS